MDAYQIKGGRPLLGQVTVGGSKNAALPILFATLLLEGETTLTRVPAIGDIRLGVEILRKMGCDVRYLDPHTLRISTENASPARIPSELCRGMRASTYLMGACLARFGYVPPFLTGGCDFGTRPLGCHYDVFHHMGAVGEDGLEATAGLSPCSHTFPRVSVGATVNAVLAAQGAQGVTSLEGCAREPHVTDLLHFLRQSGACIRGGGTSHITITGGHPLKGITYAIASDEIEAGTYLLLGALPGSALTVAPVSPVTLRPLSACLQQMGCRVTEGVLSVTCERGDSLLGCEVCTAPYPDFPTDLHPPLVGLLMGAQTPSLVRETVWSQRFQYVRELEKMGMAGTVSGDTIRIVPAPLHSADVTATDLRGGAAMVIASLGIEGVSTVRGISCLERGYEAMPEKLTAIGAVVTRV